MAESTNILVHSFNNGEASLAALNRVDKEGLRLYAEYQENLIPQVVGKAVMRPGMQYLVASADAAHRPELISFESSDPDVPDAMLVLTDSKLRVMIDDAYVTRAAVTSTVGDGDFASSASWTLATSGAASATISGNLLTLAAPARGGKASASQLVSTSNLGQQHSVRINVNRGPVVFRCGATDGGEDFFLEAELETGLHSLSFTPTGATGAGIDSFTKLMLHCDGADGSTTFTDSSSSPHTVTANGNAQLDTAQFKFSTASALFDGNDDYLNLDGSSDFAFGSGDFTVDFWFRLNAVGTYHALYDSRPAGTSSGAYPHVYVDTDNKLKYFVTGNPRIVGTTTLTTGVWYHAAVARSVTTTQLFLDGVSQGSWTDSTVYLNGASRPTIGSDGVSPTTSTGEMNGWMDEIRVSKGIARWTANFTPQTAAYGTASDGYWLNFSTTRETSVIVSSVQVEAAGVMELAAPWSEAQLREISWVQSEDVMFMAHGSWQQQRIERRADGENSWSIVYYKTDDGPFTTARTAKTRLKPAATHGNTTLTAESAFFRPEHVGALFRLDHGKFNASFQLAGPGQFTDAWRVTGIIHADTNDRVFSYVTTGTWVGTITMERSHDGPNSGFRDAGYDNGSTDVDFTTNQTITHEGAASDEDNAIIWWRLGFQEGEYTSGSITITVTYGGHSGFGICRVTGFTSSTVVSVEVMPGFDFKHTEYTDDWREGEWSDRRGWPNATEMHDGRLFWARDGKYWGSESDNFSSFDSETEGDSRTIGRSITIGASAETRWMLSLQRLIFGVRSGEISARSSSFDEPLTAVNITLKSASTQGVAAVPPIRVDSRGMYVQRAGRKLYELAYDVEANDYQSSNVMRINEDIALSDYGASEDSQGGFVRLAAQRQPDTHIWAVREDGVCTPLLYEPTEKVRGFWRFITGNVSPGDDEAPWDQVVSIAVRPTEGEDVVYLGVKRYFNGGSAYYIEKMRFQSEAFIREFDTDLAETVIKNGRYMADSFVTFTGTSTVGQVVSGYSHLIGREVILIGQRVDTGVDDASTKVLLHFNGADAATTFKDESGKTWTPVGNAQIDTAQSEFGGSSGLFDGTGDDISTPDHADFALGSSDFTVDFWFKINAAAGVEIRACGQTDAGNTAAGSSFFVLRNSSNFMQGQVSNGSSLVSVTGATAVTDTSWHHLALVRSGNSLLLFLDGAQDGSTAFTGTVPNSTEGLCVGGRRASAILPWNGWLDEFRLSVGIARWTAAFDVPTEAYGTPENHVFGPVKDTDGEVELVTVDGSGQITLPVAMQGSCVAGLPYRGRYKSAKLAYGTEGTALLQKKAVHGVGLAALNMHPDAIRVGRNFVASEMDELPRYKGDGTLREMADDGLIEKTVDEQTFSFPGTWDTDSRVCIEVRPGHSATLSGLVINLEANERGQG